MIKSIFKRIFKEKPMKMLPEVVLYTKFEYRNKAGDNRSKEGKNMKEISNRAVYEELVKNNKIYVGFDVNEIDTSSFDVIILCIGASCGHRDYVVFKNAFNHLSIDELALIADKGNLCFGYKMTGNVISVYTD